MTDISYGGETQHLFKSLNIWWQYFLIADTVQKFSYNSSHECMCVCECVCLHDHVGRAEMYFAYLQRRQPSPAASDEVTNDYRLHVPLCAYSFSFLLMCHDCSPSPCGCYDLSRHFVFQTLSALFSAPAVGRSHPLCDCVGFAG